MANETDWAHAIGEAEYASIREQVEALDVPYTRGNTRPEVAADALGIEPEELEDGQWAEALEELNATDPEDRKDAAWQSIQDDPLSIQYRSGWTSPGDDPVPDSAEVLLSTGGPAARLLVDIPSGRAVLEVRDWGKPWTEYLPAYPGCEAFRDTLARYVEVLNVAELAPKWTVRR